MLQKTTYMMVQGKKQPARYTVLGKQKKREPVFGASFMNFAQFWRKPQMEKYTCITNSTLTPNLDEALLLNSFPGLKYLRAANQ